MGEVAELAAVNSADVHAGRFGVRLVLASAMAANGLLVLVLVMLAVLVDRQSDILASRSEMHGFDPSVFPPFSDGIWLLSNGAAVLTGVVFMALLAFCAALRRSRTPRVQ
jgi:hypothetical protein